MTDQKRQGPSRLKKLEGEMQAQIERIEEAKKRVGELPAQINMADVAEAIRELQVFVRSL